MMKHLEPEIHAKQEKPTNDKLDNHQDDKQIQESHHHQEQQHTQNPNYNVNLQFNPQFPEAGIPNNLSIHITEQHSGDAIQEFEPVHDKLMHMIIVGEDLSYFAHIHPKFET